MKESKIFFSSQEAADLLNVSEKFMTELAEAGKVSFEKEGDCYRFPVAELLVYRKTMKKRQRAALRKLVQEAQKLKLGY